MTQLALVRHSCKRQKRTRRGNSAEGAFLGSIIEVPDVKRVLDKGKSASVVELENGMTQVVSNRSLKALKLL